MKCSNVMNRSFETLSESDTIARAAGLMAEAGVGFLPVCGTDRKVIGVVTDRDLVTRGLARGLDAQDHLGGHDHERARAHLPRNRRSAARRGAHGQRTHGAPRRDRR